jgi:hypothetical protein
VSEWSTGGDSMNTSEVIQQLKALGKSDVSQDLAEQTFLRLACVEQVLGLPSDRNASISERTKVALSALKTLDKLASTPLEEGATLAELRAYNQQQAQVIEKLEALQAVCSSTAQAGGTSLKLLEQFRQKVQAVIDQWAKEVDERLDTIPIKEIVASNSKLASEIEIIEISRQDSPVSLFRLKSHPEIAFPIWPLSEHRGVTKGRIFIRLSESDSGNGGAPSSTSGVSTEIVKEFRSVCACCIERLLGDSPFEASRPDSWESWERWNQSADGIAHANWKTEGQREFLIALKAACETNGIRVIASRKADRWTENFPEEMKGIEVVCTSKPKAIYRAHLQGRQPEDFVNGGVFQLEE